MCLLLATMFNALGAPHGVGLRRRSEMALKRLKARRSG
jgi:hypothetical protein